MYKKPCIKIYSYNEKEKKVKIKNIESIVEPPKILEQPSYKNLIIKNITKQDVTIESIKKPDPINIYNILEKLDRFY